MRCVVVVAVAVAVAVVFVELVGSVSAALDLCVGPVAPKHDDDVAKSLNSNSCSSSFLFARSASIPSSSMTCISSN